MAGDHRHGGFLALAGRAAWDRRPRASDHSPLPAQFAASPSPGVALTRSSGDRCTDSASGRGLTAVHGQRFTSAKLVSAHNSSPGALTVLSALAARTPLAPSERCSPSCSSSSSPASSAARSPGRSSPPAGSPPRTRARPAPRSGSRQATGAQATPGVVVLVRDPARADEGREPSSRTSPGSSPSPRPTPSRDGRTAYRAATLAADADEDEVVSRARASASRTIATSSLGGGAGRRSSQIGDSVSEDLGRAETARLPGAAAALAAVLPRPRRRSCRWRSG